MDNDIESAAAATIVIAIICKRRKVKIRKKRSAWVKPWLKRREERGIYNTLVRELRLEEELEYKKFLRTFDELLKLIEADITKQNTVMRDAIPASLKLAVTIRYLSTGASYADWVHKSTLTNYSRSV